MGTEGCTVRIETVSTLDVPRIDCVPAPSRSMHAQSSDVNLHVHDPCADGTIEIADERFIRDAILKPRAKIAAGYEPLMPSYQGKMSEDELIRITAYIKSLADGAGP